MQDIASEKGVLAGIFQYGSNAYTDVADLITNATFTNNSNELIFRCLEYTLKDKTDGSVDVASILAAANSLGISKFLEKEDERHLRAVMNFPIKLENVRTLAKRIRKLEIARNGCAVVETIKDELSQVKGDESIDSILGMMENPVYDFSLSLGEAKSNGPERMGEGLDKYIQHLIDNPVENVGISSGYPMYDLAIGGGFRKKTVNVIGARPKQGKTLLSDNIAYHITNNIGIPVLNLDTEMSKADHWNRMVSFISRVPLTQLETGKFAKDPKQLAAVKDALDKLRNIPYDYQSIAGLPFEEIVSIMRRWVMKKVGLEENGEAKPCLIIYDYLKLMSSDAISKNLQEFQVLGFQMTGLHNFAVRYGVPFLTFIQLNRDGINKEDTDVASGSDRIIWLCSNFSIFKAKTDEEIAEDSDVTKEVYNRKLVPIIARHGAGMESGDYINMKMHGDIAKIEEGETRNEIHRVNHNKKKVKAAIEIMGEIDEF